MLTWNGLISTLPPDKGRFTLTPYNPIKQSVIQKESLRNTTIDIFFSTTIQWIICLYWFTFECLQKKQKFIIFLSLHIAGGAPLIDKRWETSKKKSNVAVARRLLYVFTDKGFQIFTDIHFAIINFRKERLSLIISHKLDILFQNKYDLFDTFYNKNQTLCLPQRRLSLSLVPWIKSSLKGTIFSYSNTDFSFIFSLSFTLPLKYLKTFSFSRLVLYEINLCDYSIYSLFCKTIISVTSVSIRWHQRYVTVTLYFCSYIRELIFFSSTLILWCLMFQNDQTHLTNLAADTSRFLKCDHFRALCFKGLKEPTLEF